MYHMNISIIFMNININIHLILIIKLFLKKLISLIWIRFVFTSLIPIT